MEKCRTNHSKQFVGYVKEQPKNGSVKKLKKNKLPASLPKPSMTKKEMEPGISGEQREVSIPVPPSMYTPHYCVTYYWFGVLGKDTNLIFYAKAYWEKQEKEWKEKNEQKTT